jgi:glycosyltransferase involved in cell wall biosynthesis
VLGCWKLADPRVSFVSRMHGFDLFAERAPDGWPMLQAFQVAQAERLLVASQAGLDDLLRRYPEQADKFNLARLATLDHGPGPWEKTAELRVVSCSNLVELKRVPMIAEALGHVQGPVLWTHFGDGPERANVEEAVKQLPPNVKVRLMGSRPNREVIAWYKANAVDVFVHASRTEGGAPVALQEAASFGIPLVAADAGGVREVVTEQSGILLPNTFTPKELGLMLNDFRQSRWHGTDARAEVRAFWNSRFNAQAVYGDLARELTR